MWSRLADHVANVATATESDTQMPNVPVTSEVETQAWYTDYYSKHGADRNDLLANPEVLFQSLAFDVANTRALSSLGLARSTAKILDVGCGAGTSLLGFIKLGFPAVHLAGVDINSERIAAGRAALPTVDFRCESAERLSFADDVFDIVFESTMFVQITDDALARSIASDMLRVTKPGGFILLADWRYSKPNDPNYRGVSKKRLRNLFSVGGDCKIVGQQSGALVPPLGRFLSQYAPWSYFLVQALFPLLVGQKTTILQKLQ